jgi:hypothetical protein
MIEIKKCLKCGKKAVWFYLPSDSVQYCDDCVPRGCSCNDNEYEEDGEVVYIERKDDKGRLLPCCEFMYDENFYDNNA